LNKKGAEAMRLMKLIEEQIKKSNGIVHLAYYGMAGAAVIVILLRLWRMIRR
jgi:hypothetical protein